MRALICRLFGHRWAYAEFYGFTQRWCKRCDA